jgi:serine/threonine-protein kinase PknG
MLVAAGRYHEAAEHLAAATELDQSRRTQVEAELFEAALRSLTDGRPPPAPSPALLAGRPFTEKGLRLGLEDAIRRQARLAHDPAERIALVDRANEARPVTLL